MTEPRELRLTMKLSNNRIRRRREELGRSIREASVVAGINYTTWCGLESLSRKPYYVSRRKATLGRVVLTPAASKLADSLLVTPEYLWPDAVLAVTQPTIVAEIDAADLQPALLAVQMHPSLPSAEERLIQGDDDQFMAKALSQLTPIEEKILTRRLGLKDVDPESLDDIGDTYGLSRERIRQIEMQALGRLREIFYHRDKKPLAPMPTPVKTSGPWRWCRHCGWTRDLVLVGIECFKCGTQTLMRPPSSSPTVSIDPQDSEPPPVSVEDEPL